MRHLLKAVEPPTALTEPHALQPCWDAHLQALTTAGALAETLSLDAANIGDSE